MEANGYMTRPSHTTDILCGICDSLALCEKIICCNGRKGITLCESIHVCVVHTQPWLS